MTDAPETAPAKPPLDIGKVISDVFSIYFKTLPVFFLIIFVPYFLLDLFINQTLQGQIQNQIQQSDILEMFGSIALAIIPFILGLIFIQAMMIYMAVSVKIGQGIAFMRAVQAALGGIVPILGISILFMAVVFTIYGAIIGMFIVEPSLMILLFLIVPAFIVVSFIVAAAFYVFMPAIVFERAGFSSLGRSLELTRGYRGAIIGQMVLLAVIVGLISIVLGGVLGGIMFGLMAGNMDAIAQTGQFSFPWWYSLLNAGVNAISMPISLIPPAVVYVRLKEIKEGGQMGDLMKVFE